MALLTVPIRDVTAATPRSRLLAISLEGNVLDYQPGQAVLVGSHGQAERRPYSVACSPERALEIDAIELLIALESSGALGSNLSGAAPGMQVDIEGPMGTFTFPPATGVSRLLFVAGGTGVAPLRAMLDHALRLQPQPKVSFLYSARRSDEFAFIDELRGHEQAGRIELHQTVTREEGEAWTGRRGRIGRTHFEAVIHEPAATLCFVCGPGPLVGESVRTLHELGVPDAQIRIEQWGG